MTAGFPARSFPDWLAHRSHVSPGAEAIVAGGRRWTFRELDADATRLAHALHARGVRAGDRVATLLHNGAAPVLLLHAVLRLGATLVPLNIRLAPSEAAWQVGDAAPRMLIVEERTVNLIGRSPTEEIDVVDMDELLHDAEAAADPDTTFTLVHDASHVVAILYTSGTTGRPKGAMLTANNVWWSAIGSALNLGTLPADRWLAVLPLFHAGGLSILFRSVIYGVAAVVHEAFDAEEVNRSIDEVGISIVSVVAVMLQRMLEARGGRAYPATLRCVLLGGGPAPATLLQRCADLHVPVVQTYGLTETASQVATLSPADAFRRLGAAGRPLYPNALRIAGEGGTVSPAGADGEIQVFGPVVTPGYIGIQGSSHLTDDGWLRTGDIGHLDADGYLYVRDRRDDLIITGGENVYPAEVESVLLAHPSVREAGVIGMPDERWGQRVVAIVRLAPGADAEHVTGELRNHCRQHLAGYKVPAEVHAVEADLPRTASGKLRRVELRGLGR